MNRIERTLRSIDRFQQRHRVPGFAFGVIKKYGDDRGGQLAALLTYYSFLTLFPLLLLLVTILGIVAGGNPSIEHRLEHSAFAQFPVIGSGSAEGPSLSNSIHALHANSTAGLVIGILGLIWGSQGAAQTGQFAMAQIWNVPNVVRPGFVPRLGRTFLLLGVFAIFLVLSSALTAVTGWGHHTALTRVGGLAGSFLANALLYLTVFRVLTPKSIGTRPLVPGAIAGALGWTVLQSIGAELLEHQLRGSSQVYGTFAVVLGLIFWLYLVVNLSTYAAEANVVLARRLWPRSMLQPPLTDADQRVLAAIAKQEERRPEQRVRVEFHPPVDEARPSASASASPEPSAPEPTRATPAG